MSYFIINDHTDVGHSDLNPGLCGCLPRREPYGALPFATTQSPPLIPWEEFPDRIADQERKKSSLYHMCCDLPDNILDQNPLLYCWNFGSVGALMDERAFMGLPHASLSPSSVGAPIVNFQNCGYYIESALQRMVSDGASTTEYVPQTTNNRADFKLGWKESAACYKVTEWIDIPRDAHAQFSAILSVRPFVGSYGWWKHAFRVHQLLDRNPKLKPNNPLRYGIKFPNSWGKTWGDKGYGIVEGERAVADSAYAIKQASFVG